MMSALVVRLQHDGATTDEPCLQNAWGTRQDAAAPFQYDFDARLRDGLAAGRLLLGSLVEDISQLTTDLNVT